jgi:superfamily II DNA/RNA helicase
MCRADCFRFWRSHHLLLNNRHCLFQIIASIVANAEGQLGDARIGLLHGRLAPEEKLAALDAFSSGETPVLISTTVVEVRAPATSPGSRQHVQLAALQDMWATYLHRPSS